MDVKSTPVGKTESERWGRGWWVKKIFLRCHIISSWVSKKERVLKKGRRALNQVQRCQEPDSQRLWDPHLMCGTYVLVTSHIRIPSTVASSPAAENLVIQASLLCFLLNNRLLYWTRHIAVSPEVVGGLLTVTWSVRCKWRDLWDSGKAFWKESWLSLEGLALPFCLLPSDL